MKRPGQIVRQSESSSIHRVWRHQAPFTKNIAAAVVVAAADKRGHGGESRGAAAGAATGALIGSFLGPVGALVGGGVGGLIGFHIGRRNSS
jgi:uncharacterized protein YqgC (DUF456 family)